MRQILLSCVLSLAMLLGPGPAFATAPVIERGGFVLDYVIDPQPCPGIEVHDHELVTYTMTTFFDKSGVAVRTDIHATGTDNFYNPLKPGTVLSGKFVHNFRLDLITGELTEMGVPYHITLPGNGTVYVEAGHWFADGRIVGKHSIREPGDMAQFCAALAVE